MDRSALEELFAYTEFSWSRHARVMEGLTSEQFRAAVGTSGWPSLHQAFFHATGAYDFWLNHAGALGLGDMAHPGDEGFATWAEMAAYRELTRRAFRTALDVDDAELYRKRAFDFGEGPESLSRADVLANLVIHERGHHGDISTLLYQLGIKAPVVDYRYFLSFPERFVVDEGE